MNHPLNALRHHVSGAIARGEATAIVEKRPRPEKQVFFVEVTDTYGGQANYCWARRYKVTASSYRGAAIMVSRHEGYQGRLKKVMEGGELVRHDIRGAAICMFTSPWPEHMEVFSSLKVLP